MIVSVYAAASIAEGTADVVATPVDVVAGVDVLAAEIDTASWSTGTDVVTVVDSAWDEHAATSKVTASVAVRRSESPLVTGGTYARSGTPDIRVSTDSARARGTTVDHLMGGFALECDATAHIDAGHLTRAISELRQRLDADPMGDDVDTRLLLARTLLRAGRDREAGHEATAVLGRAGLPPAVHALAAAIAGHAAVVDNDPRADSLLEQAVLIEGGVGVGSTLAWGAVTIRRYWSGDLSGAVRAATSAVDAGAGAPPVEREDAQTVRAAMLMHADRFDDARALLTQTPDGSAEEVPAVSRSLRRRVAGALCFHDGRWDEAAVLLDPRVDTANGIEVTDHDRALATGSLVVLLVHRGRLDEAEDLLATGVPLMASGQGILLLWGAALLAEARGQIETAADLADRVTSKVDQLRCPVRYRLFGPDLVRLRLAVGDRVAPCAIADALDEVAVIAGVPSIAGSAHLCRGVVDDDPETLERACRLFESSPRVLERAIAAEAYGSSPALGDEAAAVSALIRARSLFASIGAQRDLRRVDMRLRAQGIMTRRAVVGTSLIGGRAELSPTEVEVAGLIAEGLTNAEIGQRLFVSSRTVETHVAHIFEKLGVKRRAAIATLVAKSARPA
jgi:DNA-binding NarL/FixJ family response regulator